MLAARFAVAVPTPATPTERTLISAPRSTMTMVWRYACIRDVALAPTWSTLVGCGLLAVSYHKQCADSMRIASTVANTFTWVHSSVVRAADRRSAGPWFESGCALQSQSHTLRSTAACVATCSKRAAPGIEPGTSCTLSKNHTTRPSSRCMQKPPRRLSLLGRTCIRAYARSEGPRCASGTVRHCNARARHTHRANTDQRAPLNDVDGVAVCVYPRCSTDAHMEHAGGVRSTGCVLSQAVR